jgi:hypothetical protein
LKEFKNDLKINLERKSIKVKNMKVVSNSIAKLENLKSLHLNLANSKINSEDTNFLEMVLNLYLGNNKGVRFVSEAIAKLVNLKSLDINL